jgi:hypothetical protein
VEQLYDLYQANTTQEKSTKEAKAETKEAAGGNTGTLEIVDKIDKSEEKAQT